MKYSISVIAPCYNEALNIHEFVERVQNTFAKRGISGEIVLINDASTDDTGKLIDELSLKYGNISAIHHNVNKGIAAAWKTGVSSASGEYVCTIDTDLQYPPEDIGRLYREISFSHADMVQGYRSSVGRQIDLRYYYSRALNFALNFLFGMKLKDNKSGYVICRKEILEETLNTRFRYFYLQTFITVSAKAKGYNIREIECLFNERKLGKSFITVTPFKIIMLSFIDLIIGFVEFRLQKKRDTVLRDFLHANPPQRNEETLPGGRKPLFGLYMALMPVHHWMISGAAKRYYEDIKKSQWLPPEKVRELQELKLKRLIDHSYKHVGYYRELMEKLHLEPSDIRTIDDLQKLPLLTKKDVRDNLYFDLMSDNHDKNNVQRITTSGSTGEPFICYADKSQLEIRWASTQRSMEWTGYRFGDKQARLWHQTIGMSMSQVLREKLDAIFSRRLFIPSFEMNEKNLKKFINTLKRYKPVLIDGYAESFNFLAYYIKNIGLEGIRPKAIISSAQILPEQSRKIIEEEFGCRVFDKYGSREFSGIAYECDAHEGHHVVAESYIVEILKDGKPARPGETGEVVITDLNNYCMPFIRYRIGDLAVAMDNSKPCKCGRGLPKIGNIEGRVQAIIITTNKTYLPGTFFAHLFKDFDYLVKQYQVVQEENDRIRLKIVKASSFDQGVFNERLLPLLRHYLGADMRIDLDFVDNIQMVRTGKQQGSISKLTLDFQKMNEKQ